MIRTGQRDGTGRATRLARLGWRLALLCAGLLFAACATMKPRPVPTGVLQVVCNEPEASLWLDDRPLGQVSRWADGGPVPAGFRRVTLRHPDYYPFYAEITLEPGGKVVLEAELRRQLE